MCLGIAKWSSRFWAPYLMQRSRNSFTKWTTISISDRTLHRRVRICYLQMADFRRQEKRHVSVCLSRKIKIIITVLRVSSHYISAKAPEAMYRLLSIYRIRDPTQEAVFQNARTVPGSVKLTLGELNTCVRTWWAVFFHRQLAFNFCCLAWLQSGIYTIFSEQVSWSCDRSLCKNV
jgi:hypothetical protein